MSLFIIRPQLASLVLTGWIGGHPTKGVSGESNIAVNADPTPWSPLGIEEPNLITEVTVTSKSNGADNFPPSPSLEEGRAVNRLSDSAAGEDPTVGINPEGSG